MPVMGPSKDRSDAVGDLAATEILMILKSKYGVERPSELLPFGKKYAAEWDELEKTLRETIKEMCWCDHAASF